MTTFLSLVAIAISAAGLYMQYRSLLIQEQTNQEEPPSE